MKSIYLLCVLMGCATTAAADWPTWRGDASRSGTCAENLPPELHLQWVRELPPTVPAWPNEPRLQFDVAYEPVVAAGIMVVASPNDGSVTAYDAATGAQRWRYFSEGPVRFAPVLGGRSVYFGSDDGWLYCLDLRAGTLLWRVRGAPETHPQRHHLGNNRLVSHWPVRGGPVLLEDTVYFAAGIWPTMQVFVVAVDARSGKLRWRNGEVSKIDSVRLDHNDLHPSALSPQGYLLATRSHLIVPNGRSLPALLDRHTGKLVHYIQGYRNGEWAVSAMGPYAFVGRTGVVNLETGQEVGSRFQAAGNDAPNKFDLKKMHLFEGPSLRYKFVPGCSARSALSDGVAYDLVGGKFVAYDVSAAKVSEYETQMQGQTLRPWRWDPPVKWELSVQGAGKDSAIIRAGNRLYGHSGKTLWAVDLASRAVAWKQTLEGQVAELLAANGRLYAVMRDGRLACFGGEPTTTVTHREQQRDLAAGPASKVIEKTAVRQGWAVVYGADEVESLLVRSSLKIIAIEEDAAKAAALRQRLVDAGVYGSRAEVFHAKPGEFHLPPYLASLLVSHGAVKDDAAVRKVFRALRPYGGTAWLADAARLKDALAGVPEAATEVSGNTLILRRVGALPKSAAWTHEGADAAMSFYSKDRRVRTPLAVLWYGDGPDHGFWKEKDYATGIKPQVVGGRLFALRSSSRTLVAYDVYTGQVLWSSKVEPYSRYASMEDGLYVAGGNTCVVLDPATGTQLRSHALEVEAGKPAYVTGLRVDGNVIVIAAAAEKLPAILKGLWDCTHLIGMDRATGKVLWTRRAKERFQNHALALGDGRVFCVDSPSIFQGAKPTTPPARPEPRESTLLALDARTGSVQWTAAASYPYKSTDLTVSLRNNDDWASYCRELRIVLAGKGAETAAYEAKSGAELWRKPIGGQPMMLRGQTFLTQRGQVVETPTGKSLGAPIKFTKGGCNYAVANEHLLIYRDRSVSFIELAGGAKQDVYAARSGCSNSLIAADGLLNVPNFSVGCVCNYPVQTSFSMVNEQEIE